MSFNLLFILDIVHNEPLLTDSVKANAAILQRHIPDADDLLAINEESQLVCFLNQCPLAQVSFSFST